MCLTEGVGQVQNAWNLRLLRYKRDRIGNTEKCIMN